jgi:hypothetical protein
MRQSAYDQMLLVVYECADSASLPNSKILKNDCNQ